MAEKTKSITFRVSASFAEALEEKVKKSGMTKTEYILSALEDNPVRVLAEGKEIARLFAEFCECCEDSRMDNKLFEERSGEICALLNSVISELKAEI